MARVQISSEARPLIDAAVAAVEGPRPGVMICAKVQSET